MINSVNNASQSATTLTPQREANAVEKLFGIDPNAPKTNFFDKLFGRSPAQQPSGFESLFKPAGGTSFIEQARNPKSDAATGIEAFANAPSKLETLAAQPSFQLAQERRGDTRTTIEVRAPTTGVNERGPGFPGSERTNNNASIRITVRELRSDELGSIAGKSGQSLKNELNRASAQIDKENRANSNGKSTAELRVMSEKSGYYNSPPHQAWAKAAEARTGGKVPADWWIKNDPFGGTNGNGPAILPGGIYPASLSKIGMAHDTDWTLGRAFGAGPMRTLAASSDPRGDFGLTSQGGSRAEHSLSLDAGLGSGYLSGHPDWNVEYRGR